MPYQDHPCPRYPNRAGPYRAPVGDCRIVLSAREFDAILEQHYRMLVNMLVRQNSRPNITRGVQRHVRSPPARQANAGGRPSLRDRIGGLMPPTGPRHGQTTVRGRRNQNRRDRRVRDGQGVAAAQAPAGEADVADNGAVLVERVENNTYDAAIGGGWGEGEEDISSSHSTVA
ncbi:hypothetical protein M378DRAFT_178726 [Amanita muscaria Koide BX008]|uniref:Uncharacterized protein n=1 Tax=Amanita muscaria (strain Koide BX008) TaxID=946122 RepID=A0A0C2TCQ0_AMAMK|nr:hypothetical protein M378DRAFT_178726 [Amanita muscaria Koide BX008]